jgi:hypothetical protein
VRRREIHAGSEARRASFAPRSGTRAARIGPLGAASPSASRSPRRSGRSHAIDLSLTDQWRRPSRLSPSVVSGRSSATRRTSSQLAITDTLGRLAPSGRVPGVQNG